MRLTKENINKYLVGDYELYLWGDTEITHIDFIPNDILCINIAHSNIEEITCELPDGLEYFYCYNSKLIKLPLLPKSLITFDGSYNNLPKEFKIYIHYDNIKCNRLRNLQMINSI